MCYAILLIAVSSISWVPEAKCQGSPCTEFYSTGWEACYTQHGRAASCEACKCYAINVAGSQRYQRPWVLGTYSTYCKGHVKALEDAYRAYMGWPPPR